MQEECVNYQHSISPCNKKRKAIQKNFNFKRMNSVFVWLPLSYGVLVNKIAENGVWEVHPVRNTLYQDLPPDQLVDRVYRKLENCIMLAKFYFKTNQFRKLPKN